MHHGRVWSSGRRQLLLGFAHFGVAFGELQPDGLGHVRVKPHALLEGEAQHFKKRHMGAKGRGFKQKSKDFVSH